MAPEISPNLTENVPPKPQHCSHSPISTSARPGTFASSARGCGLDAHLAQPGARVVIGHAAAELPGNLLEFRDVGEEFGQLVHAPGEPLDAGPQARRIREQLGVVRLDHPGAGAGRRDEVLAALELGQHFLGERARGGPVARVVAGLAAAGLSGRHVDLAAGRLEQLERRKADARTHQVDETGDEQADAHCVLLVRRGRAKLSTGLCAPARRGFRIAV